MITSKYLNNKFVFSIKICLKTKRNLSIHAHNNSRASIPLLEHYRSTWPEVPMSKEIEEKVLPPRTVPSDALRFQLTATFDHGNAVFYPHLKFHPADYKVIMWVSYYCNIHFITYRLK